MFNPKCKDIFKKPKKEVIKKKKFGFYQMPKRLYTLTPLSSSTYASATQLTSSDSTSLPSISTSSLTTSDSTSLVTKSNILKIKSKKSDSNKIRCCQIDFYDNLLKCFDYASGKKNWLIQLFKLI